MHIIIFTGGTLRPGVFTQQALASADLIIAADSGGQTALDFGVTPTVVLGDFDSLPPAAKATLEQQGCQFIVHDSHKEQTDTELAIRYAVEQRAERISVLGGSEGDRLDHVLGNIFCVIDLTIPVKFINGSTEAWTAKGPATVTISDTKHDLLSLIPLTTEVTHVKTTNLAYPLRDETLYLTQARGISNQLTAAEARVSFSGGTLLFVHTAAG